MTEKQRLEILSLLGECTIAKRAAMLEALNTNHSEQARESYRCKADKENSCEALMIDICDILGIDYQLTIAENRAKALEELKIVGGNVK